MDDWNIGPPATMRETVLYLPPGWVSVAAPRGAAVFAGSAAALVEGGDAGRALDALLPRLERSCTTADLAEAAPQIAISDVMKLVAALRETGVLLEAANREVVSSRGDARRARLRAARLTVTGPHDLTDLCEAALQSQGVGEVHRELESGSRDDLVISEPGRFELRCLFEDGGLALGPLAQPGKAGCWNCALLRRKANRPFAELGGAAAGEASSMDALAARLLAKEACDAACGDPAGHRLADHMLWVDAASFAVSRRRVLPAPGCAVCGGPSDELGASHAAPPGSEIETLLALAELVDERVGLIHAVVIESGEGLGLDRPAVATAVTACAPDGADPPRRMPVGWGKGLTPSAAVLSAAGEALERYAASVPDPRRIVWARLGDLPAEEAVDPRAFPLFEAAQYARPGFPYAPFDPDIRHPWIAGWNAATGARAWLPAIFGYLTCDCEPRQVFCSGTSNGLAAGVGVDDAAMRALLELVERDALMAAWRTRRPGAVVAVDETWDPDMLAIVRGVERLGARVRVALLPSPSGIPVALFLAFGDGRDWPGVTLGLGADPEPRRAIGQAVLELGQTGPYLRRMMREGAEIPAGPEAVVEMMDHATYYFDPRRSRAFDGLCDGEGGLSWADLPTGAPRSLEACTAALDRAGIRTWLADVTSADLATTPFRVVRALSPDLQPISFGFGLERALVSRIAAQAVPLPADYVSPIW